MQCTVQYIFYLNNVNSCIRKHHFVCPEHHYFYIPSPICFQNFILISLFSFFNLYVIECTGNNFCCKICGETDDLFAFAQLDTGGWIQIGGD